MSAARPPEGARTAGEAEGTQVRAPRPPEVPGSAARERPGAPVAGARPPRRSLLQTLQRAHVRVATTSMVAVGLALLLAAVLALRTYANNHLELVARSIAYSVEAAVVFNDRVAVMEQLAVIAQRESLREAELRDRQGQVLARYERPDSQKNSALLEMAGEPLGRLLMPEPTVAPVLDRGRPIGEVRLRGDGAVFARFLATAAAGIALCLVLAGVGMRLLSRRIQRDIVEPVQALIAMTHRARLQRSRAQRAPASQIAEFHALGEDFNALLIEIEMQQAQLAQENRSLTHLANHDSLTGLFNRAYFSRRLARILQDAQAQGGHIAVLYMDNDHFKQINDRYGHAVGDLLLIEVAKRIRTQLREGDLVARLGGDEFAVLLAPVHHARDAMRIAEKINAAVAVPLPERYERIVPSVSIGVALFPEHGQTADQLLRAADRAMYQAKKSGRGTSQLFEGNYVVSDVPEM
ncbi:diguanylate cyclase domain-containing protein [Pseudorhodoferax sp.]|uniref:diguanylate cyclase domain-containing protein n=1 Tax=Pseudorhodoferax sp. TaxID=1993553 RepID=UPI002DD67ACF|nr:diguanylate cyclase [Pseudorhodoferax sp.]